MSPIGSPQRLLAHLDVPPFAADALCAQTDPELFHPAKGEPTAPAKRVCAACPVRAECREYALRRHEPHGVWGGLSARERRRIWLARDRAGREAA